MMAYDEYTPFALATRSDSLRDGMTVGEVLSIKDERELAIFFAHAQVEFDTLDPNAWAVIGTAARLIGCIVGDDVLTRDETIAMFGARLVCAWEESQTEGLGE